jgi:hypothetical protein
LVLLVGGVLAGWGVMGGIYPFLAVTERVATPYLVVEGWIGEPALKASAREFRDGGYELILSTGGPVEGIGGYVNDFQTTASVGADILKQVGAPPDRVRMVPSRVMARDRTYAAAVALREWFAAEGREVRGINVVTEEAHARRTRLLYQLAFGERVDVGVISIPSADYDGRRWWVSSAGVREVFSEAVAYLYAKCVFRP